MRTLVSGLFLSAGILLSALAFLPQAVAAGMSCAVCGMDLTEQARNHILLSGKSATKSPLHTCSLACTKKALKNDAGLDVIEVRDFNHPEKTVSGDLAFFLIKSEKIKSDLGDMVMGPYFAAFSTKAEAEAAQKKYGDGTVVLGIKNAIK